MLYARSGSRAIASRASRYADSIRITATTALRPRGDRHHRAGRRARGGARPPPTARFRRTRSSCAPKDGAFDGIVTMYHDQGQIAMKLMGFERGVTVQGGLPIPITTPAHGTAYDIAGAASPTCRR